MSTTLYYTYLTGGNIIEAVFSAGSKVNTERHFRVVQLNGKKVEFGGVSITSKASPGSAARKLLTSIAHEKGLKKNKKASMPKVKFCIQEYTQGSSKKVYGPYVGHFHKYTAAELKKAKTAGGKIKFTMKPVVKLAKKNMKGGQEGKNVHGTILRQSSNDIPFMNITGYTDVSRNPFMDHLEQNLKNLNLDGEKGRVILSKNFIHDYKICVDFDFTVGNTQTKSIKNYPIIERLGIYNFLNEGREINTRNCGQDEYSITFGKIKKCYSNIERNITNKLKILIKGAGVIGRIGQAMNSYDGIKYFDATKYPYDNKVNMKNSST